MTTMSLVVLATAVAMSLPQLATVADPRIRTVDYSADGVIRVPVSLGVVTRIILQPGEKIVAAATGVPAKCDETPSPWCVVADVGSDEVWVKPRAGARRNNLELKTDRRDYSLDLEVGTVTTYRIDLRYPPPASETRSGSISAVSDDRKVTARMAAARPVVRNLAYTLEANARGGDITPEAVFDDGIFTYFRFPANAELPTVFVIGPDGREARVNAHMDGDDVVVQRLGRKFVLRLGSAVVSVWNEAFDARGLAPKNGTTVAGIEREETGGGDGDR